MHLTPPSAGGCLLLSLIIGLARNRYKKWRSERVAPALFDPLRMAASSGPSSEALMRANTQASMPEASTSRTIEQV